jgi:hypothetical protein
MANKAEKIQDEGLRRSMVEAQAALKAGDFKKVVELSAAAYMELLRRKPEMLEGAQSLMNIMFFPRLGAHLQLSHERQPELIWDREKFIFSEAITYWEFSVDNLIRHGV